MAEVLRIRVRADTVWQDSAGTIPAGVGDPVGRVDDPDRGISVTQDVTGNKPTLLQDANGHLYLDFDGADDYLSNATFQPTPGGAQPFTVVAVVQQRTAVDNNTFVADGGSGQFQIESGTKPRLVWGAQLRPATTNPGTTRHVYIGVVNGPSSVLREDATEYTGDAGSSAWAAGLQIGRQGTNNATAFDGSIYEIVVDDAALDATARTALYDELWDYYSNPAGGGDPEPINLSASAQGQALADAQALRQVLMQAEAQGSGAATAALQALRHLEAVAVGAGDAEAQILIERYAEATGDAAGAAQAALSIARQLSASAAGLSEAQAAMLREMMLEASAAGAGTARATLSTDTSILLAGTAAATGGAQVEPEIRRLLEARAGGEGGQAAALFLQRLLSANAIASGSASASLTVGIVLRPGKMTVSVRPYYEIEASMEPSYTIEATVSEAVTT